MEETGQYTSGMTESVTVLAPTPTSNPNPAPARAGRTRPATWRVNGAANGKAGGGAAAPDPNSRTITITLPKEVVDWYEKEAAAAPFEPSVQRYVAWELREWAKARQQVAMVMAATTAVTLQAGIQQAGSVYDDRPVETDVPR